MSGTDRDRRPAERAALLAVSLVVVGATPALAALAPTTVADVGPGDESATRGVISTTDADPVARCSVSQTAVTPGESVSIDASASENATVYRYDAFGDGRFGDRLDRPVFDVTYDQAGTYEPQVRVASPDGATDTASCGTVTVESGNEPPAAVFTYSPPVPAAGEPATFESNSTDGDGGVVSHEWTVDGEPVGEGVTIQYSFPEPGEYTLGLTVTDDDGATDSDTVTVTVEESNEPPAVEVSYSPSQPMPEETVGFEAAATDDDGEVVASEWTVDGEAVGDGPTLRYAFPGPGEYTVGLTATDDDGATASTAVTVSVQGGSQEPTAEFTSSPSEPVPEETVTFDSQSSDPDGEIVEYRWTVDDEAVGDGPTLRYAFPGPGEYTVGLTVTDDDGSQSAVERTVTVGAGNQPPAVDIASLPTEPTAGEPVGFEAEVADPDGEVVEFRWRVDGELVDDRPALEYAFPGPGEYTVELTVTDDDGAAANAAVTVTVEESVTPADEVTLSAAWWHEPLRPRAGETATLIADGPADTRVRYRWDVDGDDEFELQGRSTSVAFPLPGEYTVTLRTVGPDERTRERRATVTVVQQRDGGSDDGLSFWTTPIDPAPGETVTLVADPVSPDGIAEYQWDFDGDGETDATGRTASYAYPGPGEYTVTLETVTESGDRETASGGVTSSERPPGSEMGEGSDTSFWLTPLNPTPGQTVTLVAAPAVPNDEVETYRWELDGDGEADTEGRSVTYAYPEDGEFSVRLTVERADGSTATAQSSVPVRDTSAETNTTDDDTTDDDTTDDDTTDDDMTDDGTTGGPEPNDTTGAGTTETDGSGPGFGVVAAVVALFVAAGVAARRAER
jgi:PGF-CTERM protein